MCEALREIWADDIERAKSEGLKIGIEEGIRRMIISSGELGVDTERVKEMLVKNYELTDKQAEEYILQYGQDVL